MTAQDKGLKRQYFALNSDEIVALRAIQATSPLSGKLARDWWRAKAQAAGMDPGSVIAGQWKWSGLPVGHGKHWCYPVSLACATRPEFTGKDW